MQQALKKGEKMNTEFCKYLEVVGGVEAAMRHLPCSMSSVYKYRSGERTPSRKKVLRIKEICPELSEKKLYMDK